VFVERLRQTVKCECVDLQDCAAPRALEACLASYLPCYNEKRLHAALDYSYAGGDVRNGLRRPTALRQWSESTAFFAGKCERSLRVPIVGGLCGRAKPLECVSRAASLYIIFI
jgi:hypothetical protein